MLMARLAEIGFDFKKDRLFAVGDLCDRGPDSLGCLALLLEPWFFAVRGNHEDALLQYLGLYYPYHLRGVGFLEYGGDWILQLDAAQETFLHQTIVPRLLDLPYLIRVAGPKPFNVVHSELNVDLEDIRTFKPSHLYDEVWITQNRSVLSFSRSLAKEAFAKSEAMNNPWGKPVDLGGEGLPDGSVTYVGHVILPYPIAYKGHVFLDGGAFLEYGPPQEKPVWQGEPLGKLVIYNHTEGCFA